MKNKRQGGDHSKQMNFIFWVAGEDATCDFKSFVVMDVFFSGIFFHHYGKQCVTIIKRLNRIIDGHWYQQRVERELFTHSPGNDGTLTCTTLNWSERQKPLNWSERQEPWKCFLIAGMPDDPACKNARSLNIPISLGRMWHWPPAEKSNLQKGNFPHYFLHILMKLHKQESNGFQSHGNVFVITSRRKPPQCLFFLHATVIFSWFCKQAGWCQCEFTPKFSSISSPMRNIVDYRGTNLVSRSFAFNQKYVFSFRFSVDALACSSYIPQNVNVTSKFWPRTYHRMTCTSSSNCIFHFFSGREKCPPFCCQTNQDTSSFMTRMFFWFDTLDIFQTHAVTALGKVSSSAGHVLLSMLWGRFFA